MNQLLAKAELQVSQLDLIKEVAVFAERADIAEEIQRLDEPPGRVRGSLPRPASTPAASSTSSPRRCSARRTRSAAKANDAEIARHIVEIKGAIDRVKEQVQNVE